MQSKGFYYKPVEILLLGRKNFKVCETRALTSLRPCLPAMARWRINRQVVVKHDIDGGYEGY